MYPEGPLPYLQQLYNGLYLDRQLPSTLNKMQVICIHFNIILPPTTSCPTIYCFSFLECIFILFSNSHMKLLMNILCYPFNSAAVATFIKVTRGCVLNDITCNQNTGFKTRSNIIFYIFYILLTCIME